MKYLQHGAALACAGLASMLLAGCNASENSSAPTSLPSLTQPNTIRISKWEANNGSTLANSDSTTALAINSNFSLTWTNSGTDSTGYHADVLLSKDSQPSDDDRTLVGRNCAIPLGSNECNASSGQLNCSYDSSTNLLQCGGALVTDTKVNLKTLLGATATTQPAYLIIKAASPLADVKDYAYKTIKVQFK